MTRLIDLVRDDLSDLADSHPVPAGLAERAVAAGYRRRRRRAALIGTAAVVAAAAMLAPVAVRTLDGPVPAQGARGLNTFFAKRTSTMPPTPADRRDPKWQILDPRTGHYREVAAGAVSEPSANLRYAMITPGLLDPDQERIGLYETTTGGIRWYDAPAPSIDAPQISPDGRHAAYWLEEPESGAQMVVVDLGKGEVTPIPVPLSDHIGRVAVYDPGKPGSPARVRISHSRYPPGDPAGWLLENDRLTVDETVFDLRGQRIGVLPLPDAAMAVAVLPGGAGALIRPGGQLGVYALTDASGAITRQVTLPICSTLRIPDDRTSKSACTDMAMRFIGWRGTDQILIKELGTGRGGEWINSLESVDLDSGERRAVFRDSLVPGIGQMVVIRADALSRKIQKMVAF